jgi:hypothetical protein
MNEELKGILEKAYANGKTIDEVSAALKKNGYGDEDISFAGNFYNSKKKKPTSGESQSTQVQEPSFLESSIRQAQPEKAQGPSFLELPKYESSVSKATKPIISPQQMERDFEQARMQSMETGKPIDMFSSPTGQIVAEGIKQENAQVKREELSLSIADKLSAIKSSDDLAKLRPEIDEAYAKYKEFDLDGVAPTSLFNDDGSFNSSTASFLDSDLKSSIKRFSDEQKRLAENSNFLTRGLDAVSSGVLGFIDLSARLPYYLVGADAEPMLGGNVFATESKKLSEKTSLANYAEKFNMGYTPEQIEKGSLSMAIDGDFGLLGIDMADQVVNLVGAAAGGGYGLAAMGVVSAGSAFTEVVDDNNYKDGEKVLYAVGSGLVEYLTEKLFASDLKALRRTFGTAEDIAKIPRKDFGDMLFGKLPALARQPLEEGLEEAIVATTQEVMQLAMAGDKIDYKNIAESAFVGAAMGGSVGIVTGGPSALLQTRVFRDKIEIRNKIAEINELINDENISVEEKDLLKKRLTDYISKEKKMQADAEAYYSNFSEEDAAKTVKLNQTISDGIKNYSKLNSTEAKAQLASEVKTAVTEKTKIEQKYDSQAQQQVSSPVVEGQATQQVQPVEGAGTQETQAGGVLQTPQEVTATVERDLGPRVRSVKINAETVGKSVDFLTDYVNTKAEDFFALTGTTKEAALNGIESIKNVVDSFSKSNKNVRLVAHNNAESFKAATGEANISRGMHIQRDVDANEIHIFVPAVAANTVYHEALHEVAPEILGVKGTKKLATALRKAITQDKALAQYMGNFISKYSGASAAELDDEFTTELASLIASNQIEVSVQRSLATKFLEVLNKALGTKFNVAPTSAQLIDAMNSIANSLGGGVAVNVKDLEIGSSIARGVYTGGSTKKQQAFEKIDISFNDEMPKNVEVVTNPDKMTMDDAFERSGGAFVIINSDGTAIRQAADGQDIYGGFGYSFIKQNIDDEIGFAASTDNKVSELGDLIKRVAEERDIANPEHSGKPVAIFVMIQSTGAAFGNAYGAKFFADGVSKVIESGDISQNDFKKSFDEFVEKEVVKLEKDIAGKEGTKKYDKNKVAKEATIKKIRNLSETVKSSDFTTKEGHDALQRLVSSDEKMDFKTRREFFEAFVPGDRAVSGAGAAARNALLKSGINKKSFFNEYLDKNIVDNLKKDDDGGYALSGFFVKDPYMGANEYSSKSKEGKFNHPQFNSKFHGQDPFLLDGKYYVNEIFEPQQFVSATGEPISVSSSVAGSMYVSSAKSKKSTRSESEQAQAGYEISRRAKVANSLRAFSISAAPYVETKITNVDEAKAAFKNDDAYLELKKSQTEIIKAFKPNLAETVKQYDNVGGWRNTNTGSISIETSSRIEAYISIEDAELIAALNGVKAKEIQNSALISRVDDNGNGLLTEISLETKAQKSLLAKIDELGLNAGFSYTIEGGKNRITFAWNEQVESWGLSLDEYLENINKFFNFVKENNLTKDAELTTQKADIRFIEESDYGRIISEARDSGRYKGESWKDLNRLLSEAEEKISNKANLKTRYQKVDKSDLNSFYAYNAVLRSLQSEPKKNMRFLLESDISETGKSDVSSSRYLKFKAGDADREIARSFEIRFADHTKIKGSEDAKMFVDEGHKIDRVNKIDYLNAWSPKTFVKVVDILRSFGFTITNKSVEGGLKRFQAGGSEYEYLRSVSDYVNGRLVPNISEQEFVDKMNQLGVSDYSAREAYNDFLDGGMGAKKKAKPNIDNIYKQYEDRVYQQPWYKELFNVKNLVNSLFDRQSNIKREILKANVEGAYDYLISKAGASARAKYSVNKADRKIFGGLNNESIKLLNKIISLRRIIEIDQSFDDRRVAATENLIKAKSDMDYAQYRVSSMASNLSVDKKNELKKKLDSATEEFNRIQKVVEESKRPLHTVDKKNNVSLDKESSLEELDRLSKESDNFEELDNRADAYFDEFRSILDDIYKNGLITDELYNKIKDFDYSPRVFLNHAFDFGDNDISVRDYGLSGDQIKAIREGSADDTIMDARYLLAAYAASASSRILKNRANKALYRAALDSDNSDWVRTQSKTGEAERGFETVYFFEKGESTKFQLRTDLKREWDGANRLLEFGPKTTKAISYITGSALLKLLATRANPLFIVRNFPRDYGHILFFTNIYDNQNIYFAGYNLFKDFIKGVKSFKSDDKYFQEYMEMGGGMDFLSTDGRPGSLMQNRKFFTKMVDKASSLGEISEVGFRIAVYKRLRDDATAEYNKKYGEDPTGDALELIKVNSVSRARAIIDFSQGGNLTKGLEIFKPYINSAFQGFRVGTEYIGRNPKKFASKFLQAQAGLLAISALNALVGGDDMDEIPDEVKLRYLIIMLPTKYTDEKGRERRAYIKIAKPQQMVPFFAMMDIMNGYVLGSILGKEYYPSDDLLGYATRSVASAMPTGASLSEITSSVPTISMAMTYLTNYDLFRKRAVTMDFNEVLPMDEGINDPNVERFYKVIGKVTGDIEELTTGNKGGVSPARLKASTEKVITSPSSSLVVGATYGILDILTSVIPLDNDMSAAESKNAVGKVVDALGKNGISISKSIWGETNPDWKVYNQKEDLMKIDQESGSKRMKLSDSAKELGLEYISAKTEAEKNAVIEKAKDKVNEIKEDNAIDAMYYKDSFMTAAKKRSASQNTNEIIYSKDEEARAKKVYLLYGDMTDQELLEVRSQIYNESGYKLGPKFKYEYDKLTK